MGDEWIVEIERARQLSPETVALSNPSIFRVPKYFRDLKGDAYIPRMVSFGPYHHGQGHLMLMEQHKRRVLCSFFHNINKKPVKEVVEMMRQRVKELMESYDELEEQWTKDENRFLELMILDGCFLLEILLAREHKYEGLDPIFISQNIRYTLWLDVQLVENQLPGPVLAILLDGVDDKSIRSLRYGNREWGLYVLDGVRREFSGGRYWYDLSFAIPPATELLEAGVRIRKSKTNSFNDISFREGVLNIPVIEIGIHTEALLLNYIAFEQLCGTTSDVSSYVFFMDGLSKTAADVAHLRKKGIIHGWVGTDDDITALFNRLSKGVLGCIWMYQSDNVNEKLMKYSRRTLPKWRVGFARTYLRSPWVFISLLGAIFLLFLTVVQTVYAVLSNYRHY